MHQFKVILLIDTETTNFKYHLISAQYFHRNSKRIRPKTSPLTKGEEIAHWPLIYEDLSSYFTTELLMGQETVKQCHMNLCCSFNYRAYCDYGSSCPPYRLITFSGTRTVGRGSYRLGIEVCAVVACLNESVASCGRPSDKQQLLFESLEITGNFSGQAVYPTAITQRLEMVEKYEFHIARDEPQRATWKAPPNLPDLLSAGLYGRLFHLDTWTCTVLLNYRVSNEYFLFYIQRK